LLWLIREYRVLSRVKITFFIIGGQTIEDRGFDIAVGVRLIDEITPEQFREWIKCGRHDSNLIKEYIGVIYVGYNDRYHIEIDKDKQEVREIAQETGYRNIPEVTTEEKQRAIEIALMILQFLNFLRIRTTKLHRMERWAFGITAKRS